MSKVKRGVPSATLSEASAVLVGVTLLVIVTLSAFSLLLFGYVARVGIGCVVLISAICLAARLDFKKLQARTFAKWWSYALTFAVACFAVLLWRWQFGYRSLWGDVGVYINAAEYFAEGGEIPVAWNEGMQTIFGQIIHAPRGMVNSDYNGGFHFHGLPTWPALMAAFSKQEERYLLPAALYLVSIYLFWAVVRSWFGGGVRLIVLTLTFATLPLLWHQSMYLTVEILLLPIFLAAVVILQNVKNNWALISCLFLAVFSFGLVHVSVIFVGPFAAIGLALSSNFSCDRGSRFYLWVGAAISCAMFGAVYFATNVSSVYADDVYYGLFGSWQFIGIIVACSFPFLFAVFLRAKLFCSDFSSGQYVFRLSRPGRNSLVTFFIILLSTVFMAQVYVIGWTDLLMPETVDEDLSWSSRVAYVNQGLKSLPHLSVVNIAMVVSFAGVLGFFSYPFNKKNFGPEAGLWLFVLLNLIVYAIYRIDITNNFYASRYFLPTIVPGLMLFMCWLVYNVRWTVWLLVPMMMFSGAVNARMVSGEFFDSDRSLRTFLEQMNNDPKAGRLVVHGSEWLLHHLYPLQLDPAVRASISTDRQVSKEPKYLVSDASNVLGDGRCIDFVERRIPWTISFYALPELQPRRVCVYSLAPYKQLPSLYFPKNEWILDGRLQFFLVGGQSGSQRDIFIKSEGWWAAHPKYATVIRSSPPGLTVCGKRFDLFELDVDQLHYRGVVNEKVCPVELVSPAFVPKELGISNDERSLGLDVFAVEVK